MIPDDDDLIFRGLMVAAGMADGEPVDLPVMLDDSPVPRRPAPAFRLPDITPVAEIVAVPDRLARAEADLIDAWGAIFEARPSFQPSSGQTLRDAIREVLGPADGPTC